MTLGRESLPRQRESLPRQSLPSLAGCLSLVFVGPCAQNRGGGIDLVLMKELVPQLDDSSVFTVSVMKSDIDLGFSPREGFALRAEQAASLNVHDVVFVVVLGRGTGTDD